MSFRPEGSGTSPARTGQGRTVRARSRLALAAGLAATLTLTACGGTDQVNPADVRDPVVAAHPAMAFAVAPGADATGVRPDSPVTVEGRDGSLRQVTVTDSTGTVISGALGEDGTRWAADRRLAPNERYQVQATGVDERGNRVEHASSFSTLEVAADKFLGAYHPVPADGSTVGIAHPVVVRFNRPVTDREKVTEALEIRTSRPVEGGWYWIDSTTVHYRPKEFWPANTEVTVANTLVGLDVGDGVWGTSRGETSFTVGRAQIINVDVDKRRIRVTRGGETLNSFAVSTGKPGWETRNGTKVIMEKVLGKTWTNEAIDAPEDYTEYSQWAMRLTNSGEFLHDAPWNRGLFGERDASHGCVGMSTGNMRWLFDNTLVGDPVVTTGSPKKFTELYNRYQDWNVDWEQWQTGNYDLSDN